MGTVSPGGGGGGDSLEPRGTLASQPGQGLELRGQSLEHGEYGIAPEGFRLPDATHVGAVHLQVTDLHRSIDYYEKLLGMRVLDRTDHSAAMGPHVAGRALIHLVARSGLRSARRGALGLYHFAVLLPDRAALGRFAAHLVSIGARVGMADHLVSEALYLYDPDGLGVEVYADRPRAAWQRHGRELAMTTDPLDAEDLLAAGGGRAWDGAPERTTIGHVHLHVGTLREAEAFYHRALGLDKTVWSYPGALFMSAGGYHHHLGTNVWSSAPPAAEDEARLLAWELVVPSRDDAARAAASLERAGHAAEEKDGVFEAADRWGTRVSLTVTVPTRAG